MKKTLLTVALLAFVAIGFSQDFTKGNLVVSRYGDGVATLGGNNSATAIFLDEYTKAGVLVQTLALPTTTTSPSSNAITGNPGGSNEGLITLSTDGTYLTVFGHKVDAGGVIVNGTSTGTDRVIGTITANKAINTSIIVPVGSIVNPRCAITEDGSNFYVVGSTGGVQKVDASSITAIAGSNAYRSLNIFNGQLYLVTNGSTNLHIAEVGSGLPTTATTFVAMPGFNSSTPNNPNQAVFFKTTAGAGAPDLIYVADDATGLLEKYQLVSGTWTAKGTVAITATTDKNGFKSLTAYKTATGAINLYCMTASNVYAVTDATPTTSILTTVANAPVSIISGGANTKLQSVSFTPGTVVATLPISLSSFTGAVENDAVKLNWTTASEKDNKNFAVLRAGEDKVFTQIGDVAGSGNSDSKKVYVYRDINPLSGNNYYKLLQTDFNGNSEEFGPVVVSTSFSTESFNVFASQEKNEVKVTLSSLTNTKTTITIFDTNGSQVANQTVNVQKGFNDFRVPIKNIQAGIYIIALTSEGKTVSKKFIIN